MSVGLVIKEFTLVAVLLISVELGRLGDLNKLRSFSGVVKVSKFSIS